VLLDINNINGTHHKVGAILIHVPILLLAFPARILATVGVVL